MRNNIPRSHCTTKDSIEAIHYASNITVEVLDVSDQSEEELILTWLSDENIRHAPFRSGVTLTSRFFYSDAQKLLPATGWSGQL